MANVIDFLASEPHFALHLAPVWHKIDRRIKGTFYTVSSVVPYLKAKGIKAKVYPSVDYLKGAFRINKSAIAVSSWGDLRKANFSNRPIILFEHGTGQTYSNRHTSYAGGRGRENVRLFLCPNELVANKNKQNYPGARIKVVGCPKMDEFYLKEKVHNNEPVIAVSFHWDCQVCPETKTSFDYFKDGVLELTKKYKVLGHAHPRIWNKISPWYKQNGIERIWSFEDIMDKADVYIIDNSSTLFEFASLDKPVVVLNPPWYRREINHGLRFWEFADVGVNCNNGGKLASCVDKALDDPSEIQKRRRQINNILYPIRDGSSSERAANEIEKIFT